jgi:hypothetical protein
MRTASITIILQLQQGNEGRMTVNHVLAGDVPPLIAANACRATADAIDRERIRAEERAEMETEKEQPPED